MRSWRDNYTSRITSARPIQPPSTVDFRSIGSGQIGSDQIYGQAITEAQLADGSISSAKIGSLSASDITTGTLDASVVTVSNLNASNISTGTLSVDRIANAAITGAKISGSTITGSNIASGTITGTNIAATTIAAGNIAAGTITSSQIAAGTITGSNIAGTTITGSNIAAGAITAAKITSGTITTSEIATSTITGANINAASTTFAFGRVNIGGSYSDPLNVVGVAAKTGGGSWATLSDKRLKDHVDYIKEDSIDKIKKLKPVRFKYKDRKLVGGEFEKDRKFVGDREWMGFYAQDYKKVFPDAVKKRDDGYYQLDTSGIEALLVAVVQEQQKQIEKLQKEVVALKKGRKKWYNIH